MSGAVRQMITCHWTARRLQRYLDADPAAPLTPAEAARLEEHVAICEKCQEVMGQHRLLRRALSSWAARQPLDPTGVERLRSVLDDLVAGRTQ